MADQHRSNAEELFHQQPESFSNRTQPTADSSTAPKPLRITKPTTSSSNNNNSNSNSNSNEPPKQQWAAYNIPPSTSAAVFGAPLSPPPNRPLPYPEDLEKRQGSGSQVGGRAATPVTTQGEPAQRQRRPSMSSEASSTAGSGASSSRRRAHFDANDPNRPTAGGYGATPPPQSSSRSRQSHPESPGGPEPPEKDADYTTSNGAIRAFNNRSTAPGSNQQLHIPNPAGINRLSSTASTSTTRASRGSPPPPETPIDPHGGPSSGLGDIEARYAASGIPGTSTLNEMQAQSAAAAARRAQYSGPQSQRPALAQPVPRIATSNSNGRRWSPTEYPAQSPHGPPIVFQGVEEVNSRGSHVPSQARSTTPSVTGSTTSSGAGSSGSSRQPALPQPPQPAQSPDPLHGDMARMSVHDEPPPAYSPPDGIATAYPNEKTRPQSPPSSAANSNVKAADPNVGRHPAFANDSQAGSSSAPPQTGRAHPVMAPINIAHANAVAAGPASPPPLPEGWIAHLDNNSGQYYYIHLPTQSTQWEFPKGPTPLSMQEPMSPIGGNPLASPMGSMYKQPLQSPGFGPVPQTANYDGRNSIFSLNSISSPTAAGFTGPPPSTGVDMYKIGPTNGVYFGPYLRYTNMDLERGLWLGSIMLVTDATQPPTIHIHQSVDLSPDPRQLKAHPIYSHQRWTFYRYDVDLTMEEDRMSKWTYAITSHLGCTRYEFIVAGRHEQTWRWIAHSANDFEISVNANERSKLGGVGLMWKDVLQKHAECGGFHAQVGLGGQISADRLWKDLPAMRQWTQISGKENRKNAPWNAQLEEDVVHAYFHYYTSHFDQPAIREAFAQIPHVCCLDDQDIFDGYGSYPEYMQQSNIVKNVGRIGIDMYLLFQHHTNTEILRNVSNDIDLFTITGTGWHFLKFFGPSVVMVGPDTRSERTQKQVMAGPTYQGIFPKVAVLPPSVQHCVWLFPVPLVYPRLENIESIANTVATGKKVVTGGFNALGKIAGGVAGVVGAKGVVNQGFEGVKKAMGKSGLMQGVLSPFGEVDMLDELRDMWTHESKDLERTYIIRTLQGIAHNKSIRMTFLSGSVNACGAGLVHDPSRPSDHKTMYQLISAPIVNAPAPGYVIRMLHTNKSLYIPQNGRRSTTKGEPTVTDTKEDMMEIFAQDTNGAPREHKRLMGRRNYLACVAFDPELVQGAFGTTTPGLGKGPMEAARPVLRRTFCAERRVRTGSEVRPYHHTIMRVWQITTYERMVVDIQQVVGRTGPR